MVNKAAVQSNAEFRYLGISVCRSQRIRLLQMANIATLIPARMLAGNVFNVLHTDTDCQC